MQLRDANPADFTDILRLNAEAVHFLSPLDPLRLTWLHSMAVYHRVVEWQGRVEAFLLGFREGSAYDSPNYGWFAARYPQFLYIDRIVVQFPARPGRGQAPVQRPDGFCPPRGCADHKLRNRRGSAERSLAPVSRGFGL